MVVVHYSLVLYYKLQLQCFGQGLDVYCLQRTNVYVLPGAKVRNVWFVLCGVDIHFHDFGMRRTHVQIHNCQNL